MGFSLIKLLLLLSIAFVLGVSVGWWLWGRREKQNYAPSLPQRSTAPPPPLPEPVVAPAPSPVVPPTPPTGAGAGPDDLKRIKGVGPTLERTLNDMGVTRFAQIAGWSEAEIDRVNDRLRFSGRIQRDDWQGQARSLMVEG